MQADDDKSGLHSLWLQPKIVQAFIYLILILLSKGYIKIKWITLSYR